MDGTELVSIITENGCYLTAEEMSIINKPLRRLNRGERRIHYSKITGKGEQIKGIVKNRIQQQGDTPLFEMVVESIIAKKGEASYLDQLVVDILGPIKVYKSVRERADERGLTLKGTSRSGGCTMLLIVFMILAAIVSYLING